MKLLFPAITLISLLLVNKSDARWKPTPGTTWNYVLGHDVDISLEKAQVVDIDVRKSAEKIKNLHNAGIKVICYFSAGTLEDFRDDYDKYMKVEGLVKNVYDDWPDERWLDFRVEGIKPLIKNRMKVAVSKNCDGIEVDNLDAYQMDEVKKWKKPITKEETITFVKWLGTTAHSLGISIGLKNVPGILNEVSNYYDFAINEDCVNHNECYLYNNFLKSGKAVFGVTYNGLEKNKKDLCNNLSGLGMSMIIKEKSKLVQNGITFDGKKYCGSSFSNAIGVAVKPGSKSTTKKLTTTKKVTKTTLKSSSTNKTTPLVKKVVKVVTKKVVKVSKRNEL
eukprot:jgi/Orpsp1_1/1189406/evm.model.d7180000071834.1